MADALSAWNGRSWVQLAGVWLFLNISVNSTFPATTDVLGWFQPSWEATSIVAAYALLVHFRGRVGRGVHLAVALMLLFARVFRLVDGSYVHFFHREFRLAVDVVLLPESVRLLIATDGLSSALLQVALVVGVLAAFVWLSVRVLRGAERALAVLLSSTPTRGHWRTSRASLGACMLATTVPLVQHPTSSSITARLADEVVFLKEYPELRRTVLARFDHVSTRLARTPHELGALVGRDVTVIIIESYGLGALQTRSCQGQLKGALARFEQRAVESGRSVASRWLLPPTFGGGSWYAHATLSTGIRVWSPLDYGLLLESHVKPLNRFFSSAGYQTLNVMPGTTRPWPREGFYAFDRKLYAKDFAYQGPWLSWGRFPDQYVLDQLRRLPRDPRPLYKEVKLVSSHVPWRAVPPVVANWDRIGDGALYNTLPIREFSMKWSDLGNAHQPYIDSIVYDLNVVGDFIRRYERKGSLVLVLGDHQPVKEAAESDRWEVPLHVVGPDDLVRRFSKQGFDAGMRPSDRQAALPMEEFLALFLRVLSDGGGG